MNPHIVGIRFQKVGKIYHFDASSCCDLLVGDYAIVETSRGQQLGEVIQVVQDPQPPPEGTWKSIYRKATARDLVLRQLWQKKELEATINCRAKLAEVGIDGVKIVASEYSFDGSRLSFLYSTEAEGKVDLRKLNNAMQRLYPRSRVEMRQIGPRDVAKLLGGMGACGLQNRCCSMFLTEFSPISIKMAKEQGISLAPSEITGMCGRLRCCLIYEYEQYVEARKSLPKRGKQVVTPKGEGKVDDVYPLKQTVVVFLNDGTRAEFPIEEIQPYDELEALRKKSQQPCSKHEGGECDCGKNEPAQPMDQETTPPKKIEERPEIPAEQEMEKESPKEIAPQQNTEQPDDWKTPQKILVILAHPDDPEFFCGATISRWTKAGHKVVYWLLTCGDKGASIPEIVPGELCKDRRQEQRQAASILGVKEVNFLDYPDGYLIPDLKIREQVVRIIRMERPDILVTCDPKTLYVGDIRINHPDHRAAGQVVLDAVFPAAGNPLFFPELLHAEGLQPHTPREVWISGTLDPNIRMDITSYWETKLLALYEHRSQIGEREAFTERMLNRRTPESTPENPRYVEVFHRVFLS